MMVSLILLFLSCIRNEVLKYGIPFVRSFIEHVDNEPILEEKLVIWEKFWHYFIHKQWIPILNSWNICKENGVCIKMINRTNNAVESYNGRFNRKFSKQPNIIKFNQIVMEESCHRPWLYGGKHSSLKAAIR
jgi:hypothetical protein